MTLKIMQVFHVVATLCFLSTNIARVGAQDTTEKDENVGLAFGLVTAAGLSTTLGAALVFCDCYFKVANNLALGAALGFAAGVMFYVSMVDIFQKATEDFIACQCLWDDGQGGEAAAFTMTTVCFFIGVLITYGLDYVVQSMFKRSGHEYGKFLGPEQLPVPVGQTAVANSGTAKDLEENVASKEQQVYLEEPPEDGDLVRDKDEAQGEDRDAGVNHETDPSSDEAPTGVEGKSRRELYQMGLMTALAIALHNFPEGLATFVATLSDPSVGAVFAIAIAVHNIPEGLCVSIPVYYATGSRCKGFWLSFWSGISELLGAALGYAFLQTFFGPAAYATLFAIVAGMMVTIVFMELIPTAHAYDRSDKYVTKSLFAGAFVMALSLVLFVV